MNLDAIISLLGFMLASAAAAAPDLVFRPGDCYRQLAKPP